MIGENPFSPYSGLISIQPGPLAPGATGQPAPAAQLHSSTIAPPPALPLTIYALMFYLSGKRHPWNEDGPGQVEIVPAVVTRRENRRSRVRSSQESFPARTDRVAQHPSRNPSPRHRFEP